MPIYMLATLAGSGVNSMCLKGISEKPGTPVLLAADLPVKPALAERVCLCGRQEGGGVLAPDASAAGTASSWKGVWQF